MRAVLDTVVFVKAVIRPRGLWGRLVFEVNDQYELVLSPQIIAEIAEVLRRSELTRRFPQMNDVAFDRVLAIIETAEVVEPRGRLEVCRDPNDNKFFECAVAARADYIVSEDKDILSIGEFEGTRTVAAAEFIDFLTRR